ncbi:MAG: membrane protein insertase YidC, partial [Gemmatimonadota bacterium]
MPATETAAPAAEVAAPAVPADTIWVVTDVARYGFSSRGAALVSAELLDFESYTRPGPVQLVEPDNGALLDFQLRVGSGVRSLENLAFETSGAAGDTVVIEGEETIRFEASLDGGGRVAVNYAFAPERYVIGLSGTVAGVGEDATLLLGLGPHLAINEADSAEDLRALAYVVNSRQEGIESMPIRDVEADRIEEGPLRWVALKNKYFLAAAIETAPDAAALGGLIARGGAEGASSLQATFPLDREGSFSLRLFFGPQEFGRLSALGEGLEDVNPYGWRIFRPIIRPLAEIVTWILTGLHNV